MDQIYERLARHLKNLVMGYPYNEALPDLLEAMFNPNEARVALAIPAGMPPLETASLEDIIVASDLPADQTTAVVESLAERALIYSAPRPGGKTGYGLFQVGHGMPQTFFWDGRDDELARKMADRVRRYFTIQTTGDVYGGAPTKSYKYIPAGLAIDAPMQSVLPPDHIAAVVKNSTKIALANCPCRWWARLLGRTDCTHTLENCIKYDELAEFVISKGLAREISKDEALQVLKQAEKEGLVHMVDNASGDIKHTCNCCGHYCWNVGIINRRKIPRDQLMAIYYTRSTDEDECIGCGACEEICPVKAVSLVDEVAVTDLDWCIGCGVCVVRCPTDAISILRRTDKVAPDNFKALQNQIKLERGV